MARGTILLVPGTGGSELSTPPSFFGAGPPVKVWLSYAVFAGGGWRWMILADDGESPVTVLTGPLVPGMPLGTYYGTLDYGLAALGYRVLAAKLDWRQTLVRDGQRLRDQIKARPDLAPFNIVAHSRGGLVVREALNLLRLDGKLGLVARVAGLGVPHQGSLSALELLEGFDPTAKTLRGLVTGLESVTLNNIKARDLQQMIVSWPTTYMLFPNPHSDVWLPADMAVIWNYNDYIGAPVLPSLKWFLYAQAAVPAIAPIPAGIPWLDVVGHGFDTSVGLRTREIPSTPQDLLYTLDGDGRVLRKSASDGTRPILYTPTRHNALVYDGRVIAKLDEWFNGKLEQGGRIVGPLLE